MAITTSKTSIDPAVSPAEGSRRKPSGRRRHAAQLADRGTLQTLPPYKLTANEAAFLDLMGRRAVSYHRSFVDIAGSVSSALWLSYAITLQPKDGMFQLPQELCTEVTGLTRREQETARAKLREAGVLIEERGSRHVMCRLDLARIEALLEARTALPVGDRPTLPGIGATPPGLPTE